MSEATPTPWEIRPPLPLMNRPHDLLIVGNVHPAEPDDGDDPQDDNDLGTVCTTVAHILGNATAGGIPRANAELIVRSVNNFTPLLGAVKAWAAAGKAMRDSKESGDPYTALMDAYTEAIRFLQEALAKATAPVA